MNTQNSKANTPHRFKLDLADNLILKILRKHCLSQFKYLLHLEKH